MKKIISLIFIIFALAIFSLLYYAYAVSSSAGKRNDEVFVIAKGESVEQIADNLESKNLVKSAFFFKLYLTLNDKTADIKAGQYSLNPNNNIKKLVEVLTNGEQIDKEKKITIIEGWNIKEINEYLNKNNIGTKDGFSKLTTRKISDWQLSFKRPNFLNYADQNTDLEGYLFPDTYRIYNDAATEDVVKKMLDNFSKKIDQKILDDIKAQGKTLPQIITMASLIEKEVAKKEDMKIVSDIFWGRIKIGQALQSCATLAYILGVNKPQYTKEDTEIVSPYNTYKNPGLPPGPICNPGLDAIKAAVYPAKTEYNYFLTNPENKQTIFSRTYEEHVANKAKYLK